MSDDDFKKLRKVVKEEVTSAVKEEIGSALKPINARLSKMEESLNDPKSGLAAINAVLGDPKTGLAAINNRLEDPKTGLKRINEKLDILWDQTEKLTFSLEDVKSTVDTTEIRVDQIDRKLDGVVDANIGYGQRIKDIEQIPVIAHELNFKKHKRS